MPRPATATTRHMPRTATPDTSSVPSVISPPPLPPRQRAFTLYCQGHRSPAIAARLGVPERTIRAWISDDLRQLAEQAPTIRREQLQLAITRQLAIATAAWDRYHQLTAAPCPDEADKTDHSASAVIPFSEPPSRYLRLAQAAYREIDRLQGLYLPMPADQPQEVRIILERISDDEATTTDVTHGLPMEEPQPAASPAETATPSAPFPYPPTCSCAACRACSPHHDGDHPTASPAETATAPDSSASSASSAVPSSAPSVGPSPGPDALGLPRFRQRSRRPVPPLFAYRL